MSRGRSPSHAARIVTPDRPGVLTASSASADARELAEVLPGYRFVHDDEARASSSPTCRLCPVCGGRPLRPEGRFMVCDDCRVGARA